MDSKECKLKHSNHWEYVNDNEMWCPICRVMRR